MSLRSLPIFIVDAFTKTRFSGNSAAICPVDFDQVVSSDVMQKVAAEMNLSETAFVTPANVKDSFQSGSKFFLRWFTPTCEVPLCGHATLATASVLMNIYGNESTSIEFETQSGTLVASKAEDGKIAINLPCYDPQTIARDSFSNLITAAVGSLPVQDVLISPSKKFLIRLLDSVTRSELEDLKPDAQKLMSAEKGNKIIGVIVSLSGLGKDDCISDSGEQYDFVSRYFAPWLGVNEDPVTGSAHAVLAPYWSKVLNKRTLFARQCSPRGGELSIEISDSRVILRGDTVTVLQGSITL